MPSASRPSLEDDPPGRGPATQATRREQGCSSTLHVAILAVHWQCSGSGSAVLTTSTQGSRARGALNRPTHLGPGNSRAVPRPLAACACPPQCAAHGSPVGASPRTPVPAFGHTGARCLPDDAAHWQVHPGAGDVGQNRSRLPQPSPRAPKLHYTPYMHMPCPCSMCMHMHLSGPRVSHGAGGNASGPYTDGGERRRRVNGSEQRAVCGWGAQSAVHCVCRAS